VRRPSAWRTTQRRREHRQSHERRVDSQTAFARMYLRPFGSSDISSSSRVVCAGPMPAGPLSLYRDDDDRVKLPVENAKKQSSTRFVYAIYRDAAQTGQPRHLHGQRVLRLWVCLYCRPKVRRGQLQLPVPTAQDRSHKWKYCGEIISSGPALSGRRSTR
jgi:hypothetical protein